MIDLLCSDEVAGIVRYLAETGVPHRVTSTWRPGAITAAGNPSRHGQKLAVDFAGPVPGRDTADLCDIFTAFLPVERILAELIYAGPQVRFNIKRGRRVQKYAQSLHHDHVHVSVDRGVILADVPLGPRPDSAPVAHAPTDHEVEDMAEPVDAIQAGAGGVWVLTKDGGVRAYDAPFYGSYPALPAGDRQGVRSFVEIRPAGHGYDLIGSDGAVYHFDADVWEQLRPK